MRYGLPYQGSKNKLAERIVALLPEAEHLYDVFAGGCAISHCALLSRKYERIHISDTNDSVLLFKDVLEGNIPDGSEWISREEFYRRKDTDPYVRLIWSFASNQRDYIYSRDIEPYKKAVHEMIYAPTPNERRLKFKNVCRMMSQIYSIDNQQNTPHELQSATRNKSPETAWRLQSMERVVPPPNYRIFSDLQSSERVQHISKANNEAKDAGRLSARPFYEGEYDAKVCDYREVEILPNSVIYCDIPYKDTREYKNDTFDHQAFYDWCERQTQPLYISEYWMPEDRFECIAEFERTSTFSATNNALKKIERIYRPKFQL